MGPLAGLRVLDLSRVLAGPWAAQILGDLGADVTKVERPGRGDDTRSWGPPFSTLPDGGRGEGTYYLCANRNKRSLALDLHHPAAPALVKRLAARSDVVIENFKVGDLQRFGLGPETLAAELPGLVVCSITGFGQDGPNATRAGYDFMIQAAAGLMDITGEPDGRPLRAGVAIGDLTTGMYAAIGILAALRHRELTGVGQRIDMALFDVQLAWLANQAAGYLNAGFEPRRMGNSHPSIVPYQDFATATRRIALAVGNDGQFRAFAALVGHPEWSADPRFSTNAERVRHRDTLIALIEPELAAHPAGHWLDKLDAAGVPAAPVNTVAEAFADPQTAARGLVVALPHPVLGEVRTTALPIKLSATPADYRRAPPTVGQHSRELLAEAGLGAAEDRRAVRQRSGRVRYFPPLPPAGEDRPRSGQVRGRAK